MKRPTKFVKPLTEEQRQQLKEIMRSQAPQRRRMRAHAVLLSDRRYSINQIADIYQVERDRVSAWINWWDEYEFAGLDDDERGGRPPRLNEAEQAQAIKLVKEEPRQIKRALQGLAEQTGKLISGQTLTGLLHAAGYMWKRVRRSLRFWRDEIEFRQAAAELRELRAACALGKSRFDLYYFDEAGFTLQPCVPYARASGGRDFRVSLLQGATTKCLGLYEVERRRVPFLCL